MRNHSLRTRLMIWNVAIVAVLTIGLGLAVSWRASADLTAGVDRELRERSARSMGLPGRGPGQVPGAPFGNPGPGDGPFGGGGERFRREPAGPPNPVRPRFQAPPGFQGGPEVVFVAQGSFRPRVFDARLKSVSQFSDDEPWDAVAAQAVLGSEQTERITTATWQGEDHRVLTRRLEGERPNRIVQYATPLSETRRAIAGINQTLLAMLPFALIVAGMGGFYLTDRALRPVRQMAVIAERISSENLAERLPVQGEDEFAQLAQTVNGTLDRLEASFQALSLALERQQQFTADASHELRTPLTAIKAQTSLALSSTRSAEAYREALEAVDRSAARMAELVEDLLILAKADAGKLAETSALVDWALLFASVAESLSHRAPAITVDCPSGLPPFRGDAASLHRLVSNLAENAVRHTPAEGSVTLRARASEGALTIEVSDTGEGISAEHLAHLGERFYRVDSSRSRAQGGVGLGLAICRRIAEIHRGRLEFESELGKGTTARAVLPFAD